MAKAPDKYKILNLSWQSFLAGRVTWKYTPGLCARKWQTPGKGALTFADGHLYRLEESGLMSLVKATPEKYDLSGSFQVPKGGKGLYWAHPVVCGGRLYVRHSDKLYAYDISDN